MPRKPSQADEATRIARMLKAAGVLEKQHGVTVGPGDDCAVVSRPDGEVILKTDVVVETVHYLAEAAPHWIGWKAAARVVSDFAAMGAQPRHALVTIGMDPQRDPKWAESVYRGIGRCAKRHGFCLVGGETTRVPSGSFLNVAMSGDVGPRTMLRSGGKAGDVLAVTGRLGGSAAGKHLRFEPRLAEGIWLAEQRGVRAMMDLSDGLASDLPRMAKASGCGYSVMADAVPRNRGCDAAAAMSDGEDYELLLALAPEAWTKLASAWRRRFPKLLLTRIGALETPGFQSGLSGKGHDHFIDQ